ncbi:MAG: methyltransferase domain-containing protein [Gammaproteobacteria bacterium]
MPTHVYKNPEAYSKNNSLQYHFAMDAISNSQIAKGARILDLGCGDGVVTLRLAEIADEGCVIGTDISGEMIEFASKKYLNQKNLRFMQMDTSNNLFREQFDVITSFNSLHWVKDQARALRGIADATVENGKVILLLSHKKSQYHHALDIVCAKDKWKNYFKSYVNPRSFFELKEYETLLKNAGLNVTSLVEREMVHNFESVEKLKAFLGSSMANIKQIPQDQKDEFLDDFCKEFFNLSKNKNLTNIAVGFWCLEVLANCITGG